MLVPTEKCVPAVFGKIYLEMIQQKIFLGMKILQKHTKQRYSNRICKRHKRKPSLIRPWLLCTEVVCSYWYRKYSARPEFFRYRVAYLVLYYKISYSSTSQQTKWHTFRLFFRRKVLENTMVVISQYERSAKYTGLSYCFPRALRLLLPSNSEPSASLIWVSLG